MSLVTIDSAGAAGVKVSTPVPVADGEPVASGSWSPLPDDISPSPASDFPMKALVEKEVASQCRHKQVPSLTTAGQKLSDDISTPGGHHKRLVTLRRRSSDRGRKWASLKLWANECAGQHSVELGPHPFSSGHHGSSGGSRRWCARSHLGQPGITPGSGGYRAPLSIQEFGPGGRVIGRGAHDARYAVISLPKSKSRLQNRMRAIFEFVNIDLAIDAACRPVRRRIRLISAGGEAIRRATCRRSSVMDNDHRLAAT